MTKPTKWLCAQWRLRSAWESTLSDQSLLCTQWVAKDPSFLHADSKDSDQTGQHTVILLVLSWGGSNECLLVSLTKVIWWVSVYFCVNLGPNKIPFNLFCTSSFPICSTKIYQRKNKQTKQCLNHKYTRNRTVNIGYCWMMRQKNNEPRYDNTNKMNVCPAKTQISLGISPVWSKSSLFAWRKLEPLATHWVHSED